MATKKQTRKVAVERYGLVRVGACEFCRADESSHVITAHVKGVPNSETTWHICDACMDAIQEGIQRAKERQSAESEGA